MNKMPTLLEVIEYDMVKKSLLSEWPCKGCLEPPYPTEKCPIAERLDLYHIYVCIEKRKDIRERGGMQ